MVLVYTSIAIPVQKYCNIVCSKYTRIKYYINNYK